MSKDDPTYLRDLNDEVLRALQHLMGVLWMQQAGTRAMTPEDDRVVSRLIDWYASTREVSHPTVSTICSNCETTDDVCWAGIRRGRNPCCAACKYRATHGQDEPGYVPPWSGR